MSFGKELLNPAEQQIMRGERFQTEFSLISQNRINLWKLDQEIPLTEKRYLLAVCPSWNFYDLYLLDCINDALKEIQEKEIFEVTDLDLIGNLSNIKEIFGNIEPKQPPLLGIWKKGILVKSFWGWEAKNFLIDKFKFVWSPNPPYIN